MMGKGEDNKLLVINFLKEFNGHKRNAGIMDKYVRDPLLIKRLRQLDLLFISYKYLVDEATAEADRVVVRGRIRIGKVRSSIIDPSESDRFEIPFAYGFRMERSKIIDHWMITDSNFF